MVKALITLVWLVALVAVARAERPQIATGDDQSVAEKTWRRLGTRIGFGRMPLHGDQVTTMEVGLGIDHPIFGRWRIIGEYEHVSLGIDPMIGVASMTGAGHRANAGIRRTLVSKTSGRAELLVDGEAGGGALVGEDVTGRVATLHAFAGARLVLALTVDQSRWEYEVVLRALVLDGGAGGTFGIGLVWGD